MNRRRRLVRGVTAGVYSQVLSVVLQLASVPIFLWKWTLAQYGLWLVVSTIQTYLALSDFGMVSAAGSRMTVLVARGASKGANQVYHSSVLFIVLAGSAIIVSCPIVGLTFSALGFDTEFAVAASILALCVVASQVGGLAFSVFQATGRNHLGVATTANIRFAEWLGGIAGLLATASPVFVAGGMLVARVAATAWVFRTALRGQGIFDLQLGRWKILRLHTGASWSNFLGSFASSMSLQGITVAIGALYGPADVAVFNTYRTAARTIVQSTASFSHAVWPEFGALHGSRDSRGLIKLYRRMLWLGIAFSLIAALLLVAMMPVILAFWTHGKIPMIFPLATGFAFYAMAASVWHLPRVLLTSVGRNRGVAITASVGALLVVAAAVLLGLVGGPVSSQAWSMAVGEFLVSLAAAALAHRWLRSLPKPSEGRSAANSDLK